MLDVVIIDFFKFLVRIFCCCFFLKSDEEDGETKGDPEVRKKKAFKKEELSKYGIASYDISENPQYTDIISAIENLGNKTEQELLTPVNRGEASTLTVSNLLTTANFTHSVTLGDDENTPALASKQSTNAEIQSAKSQKLTRAATLHTSSPMRRKLKGVEEA
jgi:hypothetical protein